jgi:hypothetical protein
MIRALIPAAFFAMCLVSLADSVPHFPPSVQG